MERLHVFSDGHKTTLVLPSPNWLLSLGGDLLKVTKGALKAPAQPGGWCASEAQRPCWERAGHHCIGEHEDRGRASCRCSRGGESRSVQERRNGGGGSGVGWDRRRWSGAAVALINNKLEDEDKGFIYVVEYKWSSGDWHSESNCSCHYATAWSGCHWILYWQHPRKISSYVSWKKRSSRAGGFGILGTLRRDSRVILDFYSIRGMIVCQRSSHYHTVVPGRSLFDRLDDFEHFVLARPRASEWTHVVIAFGLSESLLKCGCVCLFTNNPRSFELRYAELC